MFGFVGFVDTYFPINDGQHFHYFVQHIQYLKRNLQYYPLVFIMKIIYNFFYFLSENIATRFIPL